MTLSRKPSHIERYRQIAGTLARHGLGYLVGIFGLGRFVPFHRGLLKHPRRALPYTRPEHIRMALEELGATFIKLGQILSTRIPATSLSREVDALARSTLAWSVWLMNAHRNTWCVSCCL